MGSVKDLQIIKPAFENEQGVGDFIFSDRYSIFDWGQMPDFIKNKGSALAVMSAFNFEELEKQGVNTHFKGLVVNDELVNFSDLKEGAGGSNIMQVGMAVKYSPVARTTIGEDGNPNVVYDYSFYEANRGSLNNFLVPLEIIFRNGLPKGSSVFKKLERVKGDLPATKAIFSKLGLSRVPKPGQMLPKTVISYTTKLEEGDRSLSKAKAYNISGLTGTQFQEIEGLALKVNDFVTQRAEQTGLAPHWDGKVEMVMYNNRLMLADVIGTLDEDRFGDGISKEFLRQRYKTIQPGWAEACDEAKAMGTGWQERCSIKPVHLSGRLLTLVSEMYMSAANQYVGKKIFSNVPELGKVMDGLKEYRRGE